MKLLSLRLEYFKGVRDLTVEPNGQDLSVFGNNATGKTTLADAYFWLLFGKDSQNRADFEIKTLGQDGEALHRRDHSVEGVFDTGSGKTLALKKSYREKWVQKRGSATDEFSGHETDHQINGVPVQKKEFDAKVASICTESQFRLLSDPTYFNVHLSWQKRRELLLEVCGDVTDGDVIAANPLLTPLREILGDHTLDEYRKVAKARLGEINSQIKDIQPRIDENLRSIDHGVLKSKPVGLDPFGEAVTKAIDERQRVESGGQAAELQKQVTEVEAAMNRVKNRLAEESSKGYTEALTLLSGARQNLSQIQADIQQSNQAFESATKRVTQLEKSLVELREQYARESASLFNWGGTDTCAACGQPLPSEEIDNARRKAEDNFNLAKSKRLENIKDEGNGVKANLEKLKADIESEQSRVNLLQSDEEKILAEVTRLEQKAESIKTDPPAPESDSEYRALADRKSRLLTQIEELKTSNAKALEEANQKVTLAREKLRKAESINQEIETAKSRQKRVEELEADHKRLAAEYEKLQGHVYLTEEFIRAKVSLLTEKINSRFSLARFKLFEEQINGGIQEVCECTVDGVPFGNLNTGTKLNAGLDIIDTLAGHYGFAPVIFIDNAESVTSIRPTTGQQIRLVVSEQDKTLRFEAAKTLEGAAF